MAKVEAKKSESFDKLLRRFKNKVIEDQIVEQVRERQFYKSKGQKAKEAKNIAVRRSQRQIRKENELLKRH